MESSKKLRCAWIVWNIVFYGLMIPWSVFVVTGSTSYWGGRFYPFEYNPWMNVGLVFGTLQAAVFLVIVHGVLLLMKQRKRSLLCHALALVLIILCTQPGFKMYSYGLRAYCRDGEAIGQVQTWLGDIDPNIGDVEWSQFNESKALEPATQTRLELPSAILEMDPYVVSLETEGDGTRWVRLEWFWGPEGHFGIDVCSKAPKSHTGDKPFRVAGEFRLPVDDTSYVWYELDTQ